MILFLFLVLHSMFSSFCSVLFITIVYFDFHTLASYLQVVHFTFILVNTFCSETYLSSSNSLVIFMIVLNTSVEPSLHLNLKVYMLNNYLGRPIFSLTNLYLNIFLITVILCFWNQQMVELVLSNILSSCQCCHFIDSS